MNARKEVGLDVNVAKSRYMLQPCHQSAGQNHGVKNANSSFETVMWHSSDTWERQ
jgi:hypothetical protein